MTVNNIVYSLPSYYLKSLSENKWAKYSQNFKIGLEVLWILFNWEEKLQALLLFAENLKTNKMSENLKNFENLKEKKSKVSLVLNPLTSQ